MKDNKIKLEIEDCIIGRVFNIYGEEVETTHQYKVFYRQPVFFGLFHIKQYIGLCWKDIADYHTSIRVGTINQEKPVLKFRWLNKWRRGWDNVDYDIMVFYKEEDVKNFITYIEENPNKIIQYV